MGRDVERRGPSRWDMEVKRWKLGRGGKKSEKEAIRLKTIRLLGETAGKAEDLIGNR